MGALPAIKRFVTEDYPSQTAWIGSLLYPLNLLLNTIYTNLNNGLTVKQNMVGDIKTLSVSGATPVTSFPWKFSTAPVGVNVINAAQTDGTPTPITSAVSCAGSWSYNAGVITINNVTGLNSAHTYNITFHVIGG